MYHVIGLGNEGREYEGSRHNIGRDFLLSLIDKPKDLEIGELKFNKTKLAHLANFNWQGKKGQIILPATFMNVSGKAVALNVKPAKELPKVIIIHDDLDLPLGTVKLTFDRGSGGHKGVESIMRALKTKAFVRLRVGVSTATKKGVKKPVGEDAVKEYVLASFKKSDQESLKEVYKKLYQAVVTIFAFGYDLAANQVNQSR